jgi:transcription elongation factor GreA
MKQEPKEGKFLTKEGYEKLKAELEYLQNVRRPQIIAEIKEARKLGDLSENVEYSAAKEAQAHLEGRIRELEGKLKFAKIVEDSAVDSVSFGSQVKLVDLRTGEELEYILVSPEEADPLSGRISISSPLSQALLGRKEGEEVKIKAPAGVFNYRIVRISSC